MRDIRQIIADNGNDNTPAMDTHNLTGRAPIAETGYTDWIKRNQNADFNKVMRREECKRFRHDEHCADQHWSN